MSLKKFIVYIWPSKYTKSWKIIYPRYKYRTAAKKAKMKNTGKGTVSLAQVSFYRKHAGSPPGSVLRRLAAQRRLATRQWQQRAPLIPQALLPFYLPPTEGRSAPGSGCYQGQDGSLQPRANVTKRNQVLCCWLLTPSAAEWTSVSNPQKLDLGCASLCLWQSTYWALGSTWILYILEAVSSKFW